MGSGAGGGGGERGARARERACSTLQTMGVDSDLITLTIKAVLPVVVFL